MRDIRSPQSSGAKKFPLPPEEENGLAKELYEISNQRKVAKSINDSAINSLPSAPKPKTEPQKVSTPPKKEEVTQTIPSPSPKPKKSIKMTGSQVPITNVHIPKDEIQTHSDADHVQKKPERPLFVKTPVTPKPARTKTKIGHKERKIVVGLFVLAIAAVLLAGFLFLPKAEVKLVLRNAPLLVDEKITINAQETSSPNVIAGTSFFREVRVEGEAPVTSTEVEGTKASGSVQIVNRTLEQQKIKENSRLVTEDGRLFYMQGPAIVPPASANSPSSVTVTVIAAEEGPEGNIKPQKLNFAALDSSAQSVVYGQVTKDLTGGTGVEVPVVKDPDIENAKKLAEESAMQQAQNEVREEIPDDWLILEESWDTELASFEPGAEVGTKTDKLSYTANVTVHVMGYEEEKLESTIRTSLESKLDDNYMLFPGPISFTKSMESVDWEKAEAVMNVRVTHTTVPLISIETLQEKIAGRSEAEATTYLEGLPGVFDVSIDLSPFWVASIPRIEKRVEIEIEAERKP